MNQQLQYQRLQRIRWVAKLMDARFTIFGYKVGFDSIIGLVPGAGDIGAGVVSLYIVWEAYKIGVPRTMIARMITNIVVDVVVGSVPIVGDIIDVVLKVNRKNVKMVEQYLETSAPH